MSDIPKGPRFTECSVCHQPGERYNPPGDEFWSHFKHPEDEHDFVPMLFEPTVTREQVNAILDDDECWDVGCEPNEFRPIVALDKIMALLNGDSDE